MKIWSFMILAILGLSCLLVVFIVLKVRKNRQLAKLLPIIQESIQVFHNLCVPSRIFTDEEVGSFLERYQNTVDEAINLDRSSLINSERKIKAGLTKYVKLCKDCHSSQKKNNRLFNIIQQVNSSFHDAYNSLFLNLLGEDHYLSASEWESYKQRMLPLFGSLNFLKEEMALKYTDRPGSAEEYIETWNSINVVRTKHNQSFCNRQLEIHKDFFNRVLAYPLDQQQRESIVKLEDNCLVVSSAGSGKTSTMMGKILYLIDKRGLDPSKILTITYTRKAAKELTQRLCNDKLRCLTFHKLALDVISEVTGKRPTIADNSLFLNVFNDLLKRPSFLEAVIQYLENYQSGVKDSFDYDNAVEYFADRKKYGIQALYTDMDDHICFTKSEEEKKIISILTHFGLDFRYEEAYPIDTRSILYKQYKPDFSIYYTGRDGVRHRLYLEHFGINEIGEVPQWFGDGKPGGWYMANREYLEGIQWKKNFHKQNNTALIYTTSADFHKGTAEKKIRNALEAYGVPIKMVSEEELYARIVKRSKNIEKSIMQMCQGFVNLAKANKKTIDDILFKAKQAKSYRDCYVIDNLMRPVFEAYQTALVTRQEIDFVDAIIDATDLCERGCWKPYDYILVDEFQDISVDRYHFLKSLRVKNPFTKLYCVGDDWQSIYRFSGSDMALFSEFEKFFGYTEECKIETTYRFGNPVIGRSSEFIQKNPAQRKKDVKPCMVLNPNYIESLPFASYGVDNPKYIPRIRTNIEFISCSDKNLLGKISSIVRNIPSEKSIFILGRYTYDANSLDNKLGSVICDNTRDTITIVIDGRKIPFLTIHSSKGLEADYVIVINCNSGIYGFPSQVSDDPVLDYVLSDSDHFEYGEERRVFYVGITRAKDKTFVLYDNDKPSPFVTEMHQTTLPTDDMLCPICKDGYRVVSKRGRAKNGTEYINWRCSNHAANCPYFYREYKD